MHNNMDIDENSLEIIISKTDVHIKSQRDL